LEGVAVDGFITGEDGPVIALPWILGMSSYHLGVFRFSRLGLLGKGGAAGKQDQGGHPCRRANQKPHQITSLMENTPRHRADGCSGNTPENIGQTKTRHYNSHSMGRSDIR